jgi:hypothetical protein
MMRGHATQCDCMRHYAYAIGIAERFLCGESAIGFLCQHQRKPMFLPSPSRPNGQSRGDEAARSQRGLKRILGDFWRSDRETHFDRAGNVHQRHSD